VKNDFIYTGVLLLGTNLGDKNLNVARAIDSIRGFCKVLACSSGYESDAWGYDSNEKYLNVAIKVGFNVSPEEAMHACLQVEKELGRLRLKEGYSDRIIDIDILCIDDFYSSTDHLHVPHPRLNERLFALLPLKDVHPEYVDSVTQKSIDDLIKDCTDTIVPRPVLYS